jgi:hypothetical protein
MLMLSKLQPTPPKPKLLPLSMPRELLKTKPKLKPPLLQFKRTSKLPLMSSSRNNKPRRPEKRRRREKKEKRKNKKDLKESRTSTRNRLSKKRYLLKG